MLPSNQHHFAVLDRGKDFGTGTARSSISDDDHTFHATKFAQNAPRRNFALE